MKLATVIADHRSVVVVQDPSRGDMVDVGAELNRPELTMGQLIADAADLLPRIRASFAHVSPHILAADGDIIWAAPEPSPSKIVGVALNNNVFQYLASNKMAAPAFFLKPPSALLGHRGDIEIDPQWGLTHPEPELAAVIGATLRRTTPEQALDAVFGYTIINDITSPGLKTQDSVELVMPAPMTIDEPWRNHHGSDDRSIYLTYHARSKGCDTFAPMGPWLVTADEIGNPNNLDVRAYLDDELVLQDSTAELTFPIQDVLAHLSDSMTLRPGDVVHFGTAARPTDPGRFPTLRSIDLARYGTTIAVEIDPIGKLVNTIDRSYHSGPGARNEDT